MTQYSLPQDGLTPAILDGGPYNALTDTRRTRRTASYGTRNPAKYGLYVKDIAYAGALVTFNVSPGEAEIDGTAFYSTQQIGFSITYSGIIPVNSFLNLQFILVNNRTALEITTIGTGGYIEQLFFPTDLTDYGGTPSIPPNTVRMACIVTNKVDSLENLPKNVTAVFAQAICVHTIDTDGSGDGIPLTAKLTYLPTNVHSYDMMQANTVLGDFLHNPIIYMDSVALLGTGVGNHDMRVSGMYAYMRNQILTAPGVDPFLQLHYNHDSAVKEYSMWVGGNLSTNITGSTVIPLSFGQPTYKIVVFDIVLMFIDNMTLVNGHLWYHTFETNNGGINPGIGNDDESTQLTLAGQLYNSLDSDPSNVGIEAISLHNLEPGNGNIGLGSYLQYTDV